MSTAVAELDYYSLKEPQPPYYSCIPCKSARNKQITRILVHLRDQLRKSNPNLPMPSHWMIAALVDNAASEKPVSESHEEDKEKHLVDWQAEVTAVLKVIHNACDVGLDKSCPFVQNDGRRPLFPNHELFDEWDAYRFSQTVLHYLSSI